MALPNTNLKIQLCLLRVEFYKFIQGLVSLFVWENINCKMVRRKYFSSKISWTYNLKCADYFRLSICLILSAKIRFALWAFSKYWSSFTILPHHLKYPPVLNTLSSFCGTFCLSLKILLESVGFRRLILSSVLWWWK